MNRLRLLGLLAVRYAGLRGHAGLSTFISRLAMAGFVIGVAVLIAVLSVMNGFERELRERILRVIPALVVQGEQPLHDWRALARRVADQPAVQSVLPFVEMPALLARGSEATGVLLYGMDPALEPADSAYRQFLPAAAWADLAQGSGIYLGEGIARRLSLQAGDTVMLMGLGAAAAGAQARPVVIRGLLRTGTELDHRLVLASLATAGTLKFGHADHVDGLRIAVHDVLQAPQAAVALHRQLQGRYHISDWTRTHGNLYEAIHLSKRLVTLVLLVLVLVAGFNVVSGLFLLVDEKRPDIAILKTLGLSPRQVLLLFALQGSLVGLVGVGLGVLLGIALAWALPDAVAFLEAVLGVQFLSSEIYPVSFLPSALQWGDVRQVALASLAISALVSLYPAWRAAAVLPAVGLRQG